MIGTVTKTLKLTSLALFLFMCVIAMYLVANDKFDENISQNNDLQIIITDNNNLQQQPQKPAIILSNPITQKHTQPLNHIIDEHTTTPSTTIQSLNPLSWQQLNDQQFCSIHKNTSHQKLLQDIYKQQFNRDCNDPSTKFIIYDIWLEKTRGLGASLYGYLCRYMTVALQTNRILLLHGTFDWTENKGYCKGKNAMECYFLPLSNCDSIDILAQTNTSDPTQFHQGKNPSNCIFGDNDPYKNLSHCQQRVILINARRTPKPLFQKPISIFAEQHWNMKIFEFESILVAFFMRPQQIISEIIDEKLQKSINKSLNGSIDDLDPSRYISMPIRASDKCKNIGTITQKHYTHKAETSCFTPIEYVLLMNAMRYYSNTSLIGVILTSEDNEFVKQVVNIMRYDNRSNVSDWNVILNTEDYSVGEGTTTYKNTKRLYHAELNSEIGTSLYTDHIVSALSSLMLQLRLETEYLIWLYESSWTELMWNWLAILNCNVNKKKHIPNYNKCVKLLTSGYIHWRDHNKVEFAADIWEKIKKDNLTVTQFYNKFGLWYSHKSYCHIQGSKNRVAK
eukprot:189832_1